MNSVEVSIVQRVRSPKLTEDERTAISVLVNDMLMWCATGVTEWCATDQARTRTLLEELDCGSQGREEMAL